MEVAVWDTYVKKKNGGTMHFDILVESSVKDENTVYHYGKMYLKHKNQEGQPITAKECRFCHIEKASDEIESAIRKNGYFIIEMEGCSTD